MKKNIRSILTIFAILAGLSITQVSLAQPEIPPAPPTSGGNGGSNTPMGGAAPIDGGVLILLAAGIGYGARRVHHAKYSRKETN